MRCSLVAAPRRENKPAHLRSKATTIVFQWMDWMSGSKMRREATCSVEVQIPVVGKKGETTIMNTASTTSDSFTLSSFCVVVHDDRKLENTTAVYRYLASQLADRGTDGSKTRDSECFFFLLFLGIGCKMQEQHVRH